MQPFPHRYAASTSLTPDGLIMVESAGLPDLPTAAPAEFDGPGDQWSPESLVVAAVVDCFALTFRGIARASSLTWLALTCEVEGTVDRIDRVTKFTAFTMHARLQVPAGTNEEKARRLLAKAEETCLVTRSLTAQVHLEMEVNVSPA